VEEVQMGVIKNLAVFLSLLPEPCRVSYLPVLHDILHTTNPFNWRLRQYLALQLSDLIDLPPKSDICTMLFPLVMTLLQDPVADVRRDSFKGVSKLILILYEQTKHEVLSRSSTPRGSFSSTSDQPTSSNGNAAVHVDSIQFSLEAANKANETSCTSHHHAHKSSRASHDLEAVIRAINSLSRGETYMVRQLYIELTHRLLRDLPRELFEKSFVEGILKLTCDPVINVRVSVAVMLTGWEPEDPAPAPADALDTATTSIKRSTSSQQIESNGKASAAASTSPWTWLMQRPDIRECVRRLSKDDHDVYNNLVKLDYLFPDITFEKMSCRGLKTPPGGIQAIVYSGLTKELEIDLDIDGEEDEGSEHRPSLMLSPLDLSDPTNAHIHHVDASPRSSLTNLGNFNAEGMENMTEEGMEELMNTLDMGPRHG
jgi:hypothetical protein